MISRISISNYALISSLELTLPDGLIIITGETGAGKSILMGALSLLMGRKAEGSVLFDKSRNCVVEAEFSDGMILRRVISPSGRSRAFIDDDPVSLTRLSEVSSGLIDIHAQHQHLLLNNPDYRLSVVDAFAGCSVELENYRKLYNRSAELGRSARNLEQEIAQQKSQADYREFRYRRLADAQLRPGELSELEEQYKVLSNAEKLISGIGSVRGSLDDERFSAVAALKQAGSVLSSLSPLMESLDSYSQRLDSVRIELDDILEDLDRIASSIEVSPQKLSQVDERLSLLYDLMQKYNASSVEDLIRQRDELAGAISSTEDMELELANLKQQIVETDEQMAQAASVLTSLRTRAAQELSVRLQESIRSLGMPYTLFQAKVTPAGSLTINGADRLDFLFSANAGPLADISTCASGGELSRVMLSLKELLANYTNLPTMIFDEIDTGVSGSIADKMGDMIGRMGQRMQIFAITHLPQIASKRGTHLLVKKNYDTNDSGEVEATTVIEVLDDEGRVAEVARMLSGSVLSEAALENARELIEQNKRQ
ncbi:MAG: DNA repair protein RecN [Candidatus Coprenecus sp.]